ncbi:MAG: hypothetical protein A2Y38_00160 [Spirochaetes bacterium GWB1_59_5]|nr:MAG: hypothetical protein A2Y38_00160 [Spirochaetes bacterium GWB1_59_5]
MLSDLLRRSRGSVFRPVLNLADDQKPRKDIIIFALVLVFALAPATAQFQADSPVGQFRNLNPEELSILVSGGTLFRQPSDWHGLSLPMAAPFYADIEDLVRKGGHNYIGEVVLVLPVRQAENLLPAVTKRLLDYEDYAGIPYWSKQNERYYELFKWVRVTKGTRDQAKGAVETQQYMKPFGEYGSAYEWDFSSTRLSFKGVNTTALSYKGFKSVAPGGMHWRFEAYRSGGYWILYGLGAVKAIDLFGALRERLSTSFMGRIEAFFRHVYGERTQG